MFHSRNDPVKPDINEPLAIVGMACRLPGAVASLDDFWSLMADGRDGIIDIPADRLDIDKFYDARAEAPGKIFVRQGGFLQQPLDSFDAEYFGMSPREAAYLDPQQRLLLEVAFEALEDAGIPAEQLAGTNTGVFVGGFMIDGMLTQFSPLGRSDIGQHSAVSSTLTILSNRLSYLLDIHGPSFTLDTACSSSLVATHQACQAIRHGECDIALVGGVNVIFRPETLIAMCKGGFLSRDGRSKSFDARADGYGRGEGAGIVVLKRLGAAQADGDRIHAIIRGTGVNQDGRTDGITVPNGQAQAALITSVCDRNGIDPAAVTYVEAHGTGTAVGDPIELGALGSVFGKSRAEGQAPCLVGSVKANIGHLEAAAGIAAVIKTALCLEKDQVPPVANLRDINPALDLKGWNLALPTELTPLPRTLSGIPGLAAINSFGYGGTNASLIMEPAPVAPVHVAPAHVAQDDAAAQLNMLLLSARSADALRDLARSYAARLNGLRDSDFADLCYSAAARRSSHEYRLAVIAETPAAAAAGLADFLDNRENPRVVQGYGARRDARPVFVFTGMGPQWWAMGRELLETQPLFRAFAEEVDRIFVPLSGWSIIDEMTRPEVESRITRTEIAQPANFVLQAGLVKLLEARGVHAAAMTGHSVGEVTSAYAAGVLSLEEAVRVSYLRSKLQATTAGTGGMLAVGIGADAAATYLDGYLDKVSIAAVNSPATTTLAGDETALAEIAEQLTDAGVFNRLLQVETAYHSQIMDPLLDPLEQGLSGLSPKPAAVPLYSTVTGLPVEPGDFDAAYWRRNVREPVLFADTIRELIDEGHECFLEIGPHPVLTGALRECLLDANVDGVLATTLRRNQPEMEAILRGIATLHVNGVTIDWRQFHAGGTRRFVALPSYPWQRRRYWNESRIAREDRLGTHAEATLLGKPLPLPDPAWSSQFNRNRLAYVLDHQVEGSVVLPGAAYCEIALELAASVTGRDRLRVSDLSFNQALVIGTTDDVELLTCLDPESRRFRIHSAQASDNDNWTAHAAGRVSLLDPAEPGVVDLDGLQRGFPASIDRQDHYAAMTARGLQYGPMFQGVAELFLNAAGDQVLARIAAPEGLNVDTEILHPALLDSCFQALISTLPDDAADAAHVPVHIDEIRIHGRPGPRFWCHGTLTSFDDQQMTGDLRLIGSTGIVLAELRGIRARSLGRTGAGTEPGATDALLLRFELEEQALETGADRNGAPATPLIALQDGGGQGDVLINRLISAGHHVQRIEPGDALVRGEDRWTFRSDHPGDLAELLADQGAAHVVDLRALSRADGDPVGLEGATDTLAALQAMPLTGRSRFSLVLPHAAADADSADLTAAARLGLTRVAANEYGDLDVRMIQIDDIDRQADPLMRELLADSPEDDIVLTGSRRLVRRLRPSDAATLDREAAMLRPSGPLRRGEIEIETIAAAADADGKAANILAVVAGTGDGAEDHKIGDRVLLRLEGTLRRFLRVPADMLLPCPQINGYSEADELALMPLTLARALLTRAGLRKGQAALFHLGAHPLARAMIAAAHSMGASTASIATESPLAAMERVRADRPEGFDLLVIATHDEIAEELLASLVPFGLVLDLAASDTKSLPTSSLPASPNRTDMRLDVADLSRHAKACLGDALDLLVASADTPGARQAVADTAAGLGEPVRFVQGEVDTGKAGRAMLASVAAPVIMRDGAYLVTGGFGGFGFEIAKWLADRGAGHLVLVGRKGRDSDGAQDMIAELTRRGAKVTAIAADIADSAAVAEMIGTVSTLDEPLRGVFHAAGLLDDAPVHALKADQVDRVMRPKALGAWHLHQATLHLPLDAFVMISSIASLLGSPGQGSYVAANSFLDALARHRRLQGLPAIAVNLGALADVGMAARHEGVERHFARVGVGSLKPDQAIAMLDRIIHWNPANMAAAPMDWTLWGGTYAKWAASPRYRHLMPDDAGIKTGTDASAFSAMTPDERADLVARTLTELVSGVLRLPADGIDANRSLLNMGVDSLMAMEIQAGIDRRLGLKIPTLELMKGVAFSALIRNVGALFEAAQAGGDAGGDGGTSATGTAAIPAPATPGPADAGELLSRLATMTPDEIEKAIQSLGTTERSA